MATYEYAVSFEIKADATYSRRYKSLIDQIRKTPNASVWAETTSFALLRSTEKIDALADRLYSDSELIESKDILLVVDHTASAAIARGPIEFPHTLKGHFRDCDISASAPGQECQSDNQAP